MTRWITTTEAATRLGVRRETLYAYVSRGVLVSRRRPGRLESLFDRTQVESLAAARGAGRSAGERLLRFRGVATRVSAIHDGRLAYRGVDVEEVARGMDLDAAVRHVLGCGDDAVASDALLRQLQPDLARVRRAPLERRVPLAIALLASGGEPVDDVERMPAQALALLRALDAVLDGVPLAHPWLELATICLLDNGLAASTTAARVAASARAGLLDALQAGLGALAGPLHGAAGRRAHALLAAVLAGEPTASGVARLGAPGFGHVVYEHDDPRATVLLDALRRDGAAPAVLEAIDALRAVVERPANVDLALAGIVLALGLPAATIEVLFQRARIVGMTAHVVEEHGEAALRWRGRAD